MESEEDDEDGQEEEGEISTFLKSKNSCFLDHCLSDLPEDMSARAFHEPDLVSKFVKGYCNIRDLKRPLSYQTSNQEMEAGTSSRHTGRGRRRGRTLTRRARDERLSLGRRRSTRRRSENSERKCDQSLIKRNIWAWLIEAKVIEENIKTCCLTETRGHACKRIFLSTFYVN